MGLGIVVARGVVDLPQSGPTHLQYVGLGFCMLQRDQAGAPSAPPPGGVPSVNANVVPQYYIQVFGAGCLSGCLRSC
jgi:hypothetical protein